MQECRPENSARSHERRVFSQHGEDGIIEWLLPYSRGKHVVEIGSGMGDECQATNLVEHHGFSALLLDKKRGQFITAENVNDYVQGPVTVLSIDIDGNDYWVWKALKPNADIVCIEYNSGLGLEALAIPYDPNFKWAGGANWFYGASLTALHDLGREKGYQLVGCDSSGNNAFFILQELGCKLPKLKPEEAFVKRSKPFLGKRDQSRLVALDLLPGK
jgi:hypothetical protein